jgi:hypothetical protein
VHGVQSAVCAWETVKKQSMQTLLFIFVIFIYGWRHINDDDDGVKG